MTRRQESLIQEVKSRSFPLSPLMSIMERLIERLPRRLIRVEMKPLDGVATIDEELGEYRATANAPSFDMNIGLPTSKGGWYYLEGALVRHNGNREARIHAGMDGERGITIPIPTNLRGTVREVFYLPPDVAAVRWFPTMATGTFAQGPFLLHRITTFESVMRRMCRVIFDLWRFGEGTAATRLGFALMNAMTGLQEAYQYTATLRIERLMASDYSTFIESRDCPKEEDISALCSRLAQLPAQPLISLIMPMRGPTAEFLRKAIDAVLGQAYPHWELLLAGDFSEDTEGHAIAHEYPRKDPRVRLVQVSSGGGLCGSFNRAAELARGEFIAGVGQHDPLPHHALVLLAGEISDHPDASLIYTDDDCMDETGRRFCPRFKPDWNPDLLLSHNYLSSLTCYRRADMLAAGGYRTGFEGAEDYDLMLRYLKDVPPARIRHIPRILYHARVMSGEREEWGEHPFRATSSGCSSETMAHDSGKRALQSHLEGSGIAVEDGAAPGLYRIRHPIPSPRPLVSIIIPTRDRVEILKACIDSVQKKTDYENWEILVVDNQSQEPATHAYFESLKRDRRFRVIRYDRPFNYSAMNNMAVRFARGEVLALLNNDVEVISEGWLSEMVSHAIRPGVGVVGAKLLYSNGMIQHAGVITGIGGVAGHVHKYLNGNDHGYCHRAVVTQNLSAVTGACQVVRKSCYLEAGGLNEDDLVVALNDVDFCLKLVKKGYRNVFTPYALLYHHESISRGANDTPEKRALFSRELEYMKRTWGHVLQHDPAYNPNLSLEFEDFSLRKQA